jgi:hypothetical protein
MAPRVAPASMNAVNECGGLPVVRIDWRFEVADSISARANKSPSQMPDIRLQAILASLASKIDLFTRGWSPYTTC